MTPKNNPTIHENSKPLFSMKYNIHRDGNL